MKTKTLLAASIRALFGRSRKDDMVRLDGVERLHVASRRRRLAVSLDGEVVRVEPPLNYRIRRKAFLAGRIPKKLYATASSPEEGTFTSKPR